MSAPLVSVVLPVYNAEPHLREALDSLRVQTCTDFEVLLMDDASTDGSRRIALEYARQDGRFKVLPNTQGKGLAGALNSGLAAATGTYVARMDADDINLPERFAQQVAFLEAHPEVVVCGTWVRLFGEHAGQEWKLATDWATIRCTMLFYGALAHPTVMWRRADFEKQAWRYDATCSTEDYELWVRIATQACMANLPEILYLYRTHPASYTRNNQKAAGDIARIQARQFQQLAVTPTPEELAIHGQLSRSEIPPTPDFVRQASAWLDKLLAANASSGFFPAEAFAHFIAGKQQQLRDVLSNRTQAELASQSPAPVAEQNGGAGQPAKVPAPPATGRAARGPAPLVTVLMPIFNAETYLRAAVDSILSQTHQAFEFLIVDDRSTDGSRRIAEEYAQRDARIKVLSNTRQKGVAGALDTGLDAAAGVYLARMDADDVSLPERLAHQAAYLEEHPDVTLCGTWVRLTGEHAGQEWKLATDWDSIRCTMLFCGVVAHPTVMWRRADFERHHWRYDVAWTAQDYELWTRIAETARMVNLPEILLLYRTHAQNTTKRSGDKHRQNNARIHERQLRRLNLVPTAEELEVHERIGREETVPTPDFTRRANAWLNKLLAANRSTGFFPAAAFKRLIAQKKQDIRARVSWRTTLLLGPVMLLRKAVDELGYRLPRPVAARPGSLPAPAGTPPAQPLPTSDRTAPAGATQSVTAGLQPEAARLSGGAHPLVTVMMPVYNAAAHLPAAIESILAQTFTQFELLIIDDHSTDNSLQIAERYRHRDARIRLVANPLNTGTAAVRNLGLDLARGAYLANMDADDISLPERLAAQVAYLDAHPEVSVCGTWVRLIGAAAGTVWKLATDWDTIRCTMLFYGALANPTAMLRRADFLQHHWRYANGVITEDYELWARIAETARIDNLPQVLFLYRNHAASYTNRYAPQHRREGRAIHLRQLARMGLTPSPAEMGIHEALSRNRLRKKLEFARQAQAWLDKLLVANRSSQFLPVSAFERFILTKRLDIRTAMSWRAARTMGWMTVLGKAKDLAKRFVPQPVAERLGRLALRWWPVCLRLVAAARRLDEALHTLTGRCCRLQKTLPPKFKIGMAVLAHERPEYLELCLDSLFKTNLHDYDITFLIVDDGSTDPRVRELINRPRDPRYKIVRAFTPKGPDSWGAAFNKAMRQLLALDQFDLVGSCDTDALFHPDWLDETLKVCLWAKRHHKWHVLGPFSSFNSSDFAYHQVLGTYASPHGGYWVKKQMGAVNYFYFRSDFEQLGFFAENRDDETLMTERFAQLKVRNFCTATSYVEHLGQESILNQWRPVPVRRAVHGMQLAPTGWDCDMERLSPYPYYRYLKKNATFGPGLTPSAWPIDVLMPVIRKDLVTLPLAVAGLRKNLRHPLGKIILVSPPDAAIQDFCRQHGCAWRDENKVLPLKPTDIHYEVNGVNRAGWIFKQILQLHADQICEAEHILLLDSDTVLLQPQKFEHEGRSLMLVSDEFHWPYFVTFQKMFGYLPPARFSLIAHHLLVNRHRLAELRAELEQRHHRPLHQVIVDHIDPNEGSTFAEYETYGQWMLQHHRDQVELEYWFNVALPRRRVWRHAWDARRCSQAYRAVSYHHHHV